MNKCNRSGCGREVASDKYACGPHWFQLPLEIRTAISDGYRKSMLLWRDGHRRAQEFWAKESADGRPDPQLLFEGIDQDLKNETAPMM